MNPKLQAHLKSLGVNDVGDPASVWLALHADLGDRATLIHRYELEAASRAMSVEELSDDDRSRLQLEVLPVLFPGWTREGSASPVDPIVVVDYEPVWAEHFEALRACLAAALGDLGVRIEHMGSTAVVGLAAKPVIDIMVGVPDVEDEASYVSHVESCGVTLRSSDEGHRYFKPMPPKPRTAQVHVVDRDGEWQRSHLLFRDYLRSHPEAAVAYGNLKKRLAETYRTDRLGYNAAKTDFIFDHLALAEEWSDSQPSLPR